MTHSTKTTLLSTKTTAHYLSDNSKPPIVTSGELMPELLANFENGCYAYFSMKDVSDNKQVLKIMWGLQDARVQVWYRADCDTTNKGSFSDFMKAVRAN